MTRLLLSCGEASGDLYAGALVEALRRREPDIDVFGLGGERFAAAGGRLIADFHGMSVTGLAEALSVIPRSIATLRKLTKAAREQKPHALVVIDYPGLQFSTDALHQEAGHSRSSITSVRSCGRGGRGASS